MRFNTNQKVKKKKKNTSWDEFESQLHACQVYCDIVLHSRSQAQMKEMGCSKLIVSVKLLSHIMNMDPIVYESNTN